MSGGISLRAPSNVEFGLEGIHETLTVNVWRFVGLSLSQQLILILPVQQVTPPDADDFPDHFRFGPMMPDRGASDAFQLHIVKPDRLDFLGVPLIHLSSPPNDNTTVFYSAPCFESSEIYST